MPSNIAVERPHHVEILEYRLTVALDSASLAEGRFDLAARRVGASRLVLSGGSTRIVRGANGHIDLLDAVAATPKDATPTNAAASPWQYAIDKILLHKFALAARDLSYSPPLALDAQIDATIDHLASTGPVAFDATLALAQDRGRVTPRSVPTCRPGAASLRTARRA